MEATHCPRQNASSYHHTHTALSEIWNRIVGKKYYYALFDFTHYFYFNVGFANIVVQSSGQPGVEMKYGVPAVWGQWEASIIPVSLRSGPFFSL